MKKWIVLFSVGFSTLIMFNTCRVSYMFMSYKLDPVSFIENYCINKDKPELHCNGKCQLKKVTQSSENEKEAVKFLNYELLLFHQLIEDYQIHSTVFTPKNECFSYLNLYSFNFKLSCFHPPRV
ncbi:hypothetical protein [Algibacter pacificus]|uniref:hypothetical protein n=1 Tax=Algibacter pacificus TaxID=2599389 RepID=UPI0011C79FA6|nr:hypothetical protein [Algibacter pacificus]